MQLREIHQKRGKELKHTHKRPSTIKDHGLIILLIIIELERQRRPKIWTQLKPQVVAM